MISEITWEVLQHQNPSNFINRLTSEESDRLIYLYLCFIGAVNFEKDDIHPIDDDLAHKHIISVGYSRNYQRVRSFNLPTAIINSAIDVDVKILVPIEILFSRINAIKKVEIINLYGTKRINEFTSIISELVNELSIEDLPTFLASDNSIISNRAKQRFDKLTKENLCQDLNLKKKQKD